MHRLLVVLMILLAGCEPYRVEYHKRPEFYQAATEEELPDEIIMPDGTKIVYVPVNRRTGQMDNKGGGKTFRPREQLDDGTVLLRAILPEHVLLNTLACVKYEEYELLWDQMVSERTKAEFEHREETYEDFAKWCEKYRIELTKMMNRMAHGILLHDVILEPVEPGVMQYRFQPTVAELFQFKRLVITSEPPNGLKLLFIR